MKSPIEEMLLGAFVDLAEAESNDLWLCSYCDYPNMSGIVDADGVFVGVGGNGQSPVDYGDGNNYWALYRDAFVAGYKIDFLLVHDWRDLSGKFALAVECDGHEFHERTKQQASQDRARDRALLLLGIPTLRFTGSDIYRDRHACALEIINTGRALVERRIAYDHAVWLHGHEIGKASAQRDRASLDDHVVGVGEGLI